MKVQLVPSIAGKHESWPKVTFLSSHVLDVLEYSNDSQLGRLFRLVIRL